MRASPISVRVSNFNVLELKHKLFLQMFLIANARIACSEVGFGTDPNMWLHLVELVLAADVTHTVHLRDPTHPMVRHFDGTPNGNLFRMLDYLS